MFFLNPSIRDDWEKSFGLKKNIVNNLISPAFSNRRIKYKTKYTTQYNQFQNPVETEGKSGLSMVNVCQMYTNQVKMRIQNKYKNVDSPSVGRGLRYFSTQDS